MRTQQSPTRQRCALLSGAVLCLTLLGSGSAAQARAAGRPDLRVVAATADAAAATGGRVYVQVKVRNAGPGRASASKLQLSLGTAKLKRLTPIRALARGRSVKVLAYGALPASARRARNFASRRAPTPDIASRSPTSATTAARRSPWS